MKKQTETVSDFSLLFYNLFSSPQSHIVSSIGIRDFPRSVRLYSTLGGICGYSSLWTNLSASKATPHNCYDTHYRAAIL